MEQYGNTTTYNVESVLQKNVVNSEYFRDTCMKLSSWEEVVDEIYYSVQDVEPWMSGNARGASSAFCLLYRSVRCAVQAALVLQTISAFSCFYLFQRTGAGLGWMSIINDHIASLTPFYDRRCSLKAGAIGSSPWFLLSSKSKTFWTMLTPHIFVR